MDDSINFGKIFRGILALHGPSGGGKNEISLNVQKIADELKIHWSYISSGDGFRKFNEEIKGMPDSVLTLEQIELKVMNQGGYVETLDLVMPPLVDIFEEYFLNILQGKDSIAILDGYLRVGEFESKGKVIPSQIDQVAEGALRGLSKALNSEKVSRENALKFIPVEIYEQVLNYEPTKYADIKREGLLKNFSEALINDSRHVVIDIPIPDAESLMRFRSLKAIKKLGNSLVEHWDKTKDPTEMALLGVLGDALLLQSGRFEITESNDIRLHRDKTDRSLKGFPKDEDYSKIVDSEMLAIVEDGYLVLGLEYTNKHNLKTLCEEINERFNGVFDFRILGELRPDDLSALARWKRLAEYMDKAHKMIIQGELHIEFGDKASNKENVGVVRNGPDLGKTSYEELQSRCQKEGQTTVIYMFGENRVTLEGQIVAGERSTN